MDRSGNILVQLIQNGFFCEYEMRVFIRMFFSENDDGIVITDFSYKDNLIIASAKIEFQKKIFEKKYEYVYKKRNERTDKIVFRCFVVRAFCDAAQNIKKVSIPWGALSGIRPAKVVRQMFEKSMTEEEVKKDLKEIFGVMDEKTELAIKVSENEKKLLENLKENSASIYVGIPFCPSKCLYCSFVSNDMRTAKKYTDEYTRLLKEEIKKAAEVAKRLNFSIENIYIGGGTPSSLNENQLEEIFFSLSENFNLSGLNEFTFEAGRADTITTEKLNIAKKYGVDRISINPQTMIDKTLELVGRKHTAQMVREAFKIAKKCGFKIINMDLIAGLPGETPDDFKYSLDEVIKLDPENITIHSLCIKRAAKFRFSKYNTASFDDMNEMLNYTQKRMKETGREPYYMYRQKNISGNLENVGYAKKDCYSFYNVNIMEEVQNIIALGGGGTSKLVKGDRIERIFNFKDACEYIKRFDEIIEKKEEFYKIYSEM